MEFSKYYFTKNFSLIYIIYFCILISFSVLIINNQCFDKNFGSIYPNSTYHLKINNFQEIKILNSKNIFHFSKNGYDVKKINIKIEKSKVYNIYLSRNSNLTTTCGNEILKYIDEKYYRIENNTIIFLKRGFFKFVNTKFDYCSLLINQYNFNTTGLKTINKTVFRKNNVNIIIESQDSNNILDTTNIKIQKINYGHCSKIIVIIIIFTISPIFIFIIFTLLTRPNYYNYFPI